MEQILPVSEARRQLHQLLESLRQRPEQRYQIAVHGTVMAHLIAPPPWPKPGTAARALLRLSHRVRPRRRTKATRISEEHDRYLYGSPSSR